MCFWIFVDPLNILTFYHSRYLSRDHDFNAAEKYSMYPDPLHISYFQINNDARDLTLTIDLSDSLIHVVFIVPGDSL